MYRKKKSVLYQLNKTEGITDGLLTQSKKKPKLTIAHNNNKTKTKTKKKNRKYTILAPNEAR